MLSQVLFIRNIKIAILKKDISKTTLKRSTGIVLQDWLHYNALESKQMWVPSRLSFHDCVTWVPS